MGITAELSVKQADGQFRFRRRRCVADNLLKRQYGGNAFSARRTEPLHHQIEVVRNCELDEVASLRPALASKTKRSVIELHCRLQSLGVVVVCGHGRISEQRPGIRRCRESRNFGNTNNTYTRI